MRVRGMAVRLARSLHKLGQRGGQEGIIVVVVVVLVMVVLVMVGVVVMVAATVLGAPGGQ